MLRAAVLLPFLRGIQRFNTVSRPTALVACYVAPWQLPRLDFTCTALRSVQCRCHQQVDDSFQDTPANG